MFRFLPVLFALLLGGCSTAELIQRTYEPQKSGVVKFQDGLMAFMGGEKGRTMAEEKMRNFCAPKPFRILRETDKEIVQTKSQTTNNKDGGSSTVSTTGASSGSMTYASFACR
ncbi:MAG: hypothetical protein KF767_05625 [Bdellovibrionaceae bacterium]|nr:hypothetical protein [Pseudobdellovibrionaceae bacterium]